MYDLYTNYLKFNDKQRKYKRPIDRNKVVNIEQNHG